MSFTTAAAVISGFLGAFSAVPYIRAILNGKTKPHQFSWLVFCIMNGINFFSQFLAGGRKSVVLYGTFFVGSVVILALSLKYGVRNTSKWDKILLTFALATIAIWVITQSNTVAIWLAILIDIFAETILILKIRNRPNSEDPLAWIIATTGLAFTCLTLFGTPPSILYVRPIYSLFINSLTVASIYYFRKGSHGRVTSSPLEVD